MNIVRMNDCANLLVPEIMALWCRAAIMILLFLKLKAASCSFRPDLSLFPLLRIRGNCSHRLLASFKKLNMLKLLKRFLLGQKSLKNSKM